MQSLIQLRKISLALAITQILILPVAQAATITVNNFDDVSAVDGNCTLREAIVSANTNTATGGCTSGDSGPDTISFAAVGVGAGQTIVLTEAPALEIASGEELIIDGPGADLLTIDGNKSTRTTGIFHLNGATATINALTISNGARLRGGGILAFFSATVNLTDSVVSGNMATFYSGGGIFAYGSDITLTNTTVSGNSAAERGGGIMANESSTVTLTNSTVSGNEATEWGGGIMAGESSTVTLTNSTVSGNEGTWGGGIIADGDSAVTLDRSTVSGNMATGHSGGGIIASSGSNAILSNSTVSGNYAYNLGGGISVNNSSLNLTNTTVSDNIARIGGAGISVHAAENNTSTAILSNSVIAYSSGDAEESTDCYMSVEGEGEDIGTTSVTADVHNIIADGSCADSPTNFALSDDPMLGPLADNGGPTKTHKLLVESPAIEAGDNIVCAAALVNNLDQRGVDRPQPQGAICDIGAFEFKDYLQGLTIIKVVTNGHGGTAVAEDFTLHLTGGIYTGTEAMTSGDTPDVEASIEYTLSEATFPGYTQTGDVVCTDDNGGGAGVAHPVTLNENQNVTCTISNEEDAVAPPKLTLIKLVTNDHGGDAEPNDFLLTVGGTVVSSGETNTYLAGTYALNETLLPGYEFTSLTGDAECPTVLGDPVTLAAEDDITCTITNGVVTAQLTLEKVVNGGSAQPDDFSLTVDGGSVLSGVQNTYLANTPLALDETLSPGYEFASLTGDVKCPDALGDPVILAPGDDITCTITNDEVAPTAQLTLVKTVNGGTALPDDFSLTVSGIGVDSGEKHIYLANTALVLNESLLSGYTFTSLGDSLGDDPKCPDALGGTVTLVPGEDITCTITNDAVAPITQLTLIKAVVNGSGGNADASDFTLHLTGGIYTGTEAMTSGDTPDVEASIEYTLSEATFPGYTQMGDVVCTDDNGGAGVAHPVTLNEGQNVTCTITNDDIQPGLTILKDVSNVNGGNADASDFILHLTGGFYNGTEEFKSGNTPVVEANEPYTLSETTLSGYIMTGISCTDDDGGAGVAHPVTLNEGQNVTCTISNTDGEDSVFYVIPIADGGAVVIYL